MAPDTTVLHDRVTEADVLRFVEQWMTVLSNLARYPATNRAVAQSIQRLYEMLPTVLGDQPAIEFAELHNMLLINGEGLSLEMQNKDSVGAFVFVLLENNIRAMTIRRDVTDDEFHQLLMALSRVPGEQANRIEQSLAENGVVRIELELQVRPHESMPDVTADEYEAMQERAEAETKQHPQRIDPRHARTEVRKPGTFRATVIVRVGTMALEEAEVTSLLPEKQVKRTKGEQGAVLFLPPGENEITVIYEDYKVTRTLEINDEEQTFEIDLQSIFDY